MNGHPCVRACNCNIVIKQDLDGMFKGKNTRRKRNRIARAVFLTRIRHTGMFMCGAKFHQDP
jgi:hypothetical protein